MKGDLVQELHRVFQAAGYHTFMLPCEMDYDTLAYDAHLVELPMFIYMKMAFNEDSMKYNHIIGLRPIFPMAGQSSEYQLLMVLICNSKHCNL